MEIFEIRFGYKFVKIFESHKVFDKNDLMIAFKFFWVRALAHQMAQLVGVDDTFGFQLFAHGVEAAGGHEGIDHGCEDHESHCPGDALCSG